MQVLSLTALVVWINGGGLQPACKVELKLNAPGDSACTGARCQDWPHCTGYSPASRETIVIATVLMQKGVSFEKQQLACRERKARYEVPER